MNINLKFISLSVFVMFLSSSCATNKTNLDARDISIKKSSQATTSFKEFIRGDAILPLGKHSYSSIKDVLEYFYNRDGYYGRLYVANDLLNNFPESDLSYYMLGKIAESLGYLHAARKYLVKSKQESLLLKFCNDNKNCTIKSDTEESLLRIERAISSYCPNDYLLEINTVSLIEKVSGQTGAYMHTVKFGNENFEVIDGKVLIPNCLNENKITLYQGGSELFSANLSPRVFDAKHPFNQGTWLIELAKYSLFKNQSTEEIISGFDFYWSLLNEHDKELFSNKFNDSLNKLIAKLSETSSFNDLATLLNNEKFTHQVLRNENFVDKKARILKSIDSKFSSLILKLRNVSEFKTFISDCMYFNFAGFYCRDKFYIIDKPESLYGAEFSKSSSFSSLKDSTYGMLFKIDSIESENRIINRRNVNSSYIADTHSVPNPESIVAQTEYERSILKYESYMANEYNKSYHGTSTLGAVVAGYNKASEKRRLEEEIELYKNKMLSTPSTINKEIKQNYQYEMQTKRIDLIINGTLFFSDRTNSWCKGAKFQFKRTKDFEFPYGAKGDDLLKGSSEQEVKSWIEESENLNFDHMEPVNKGNFYDCVNNLKG